MQQALAYNVDGFVYSDWGISLSSNTLGYLNGQTPTNPTADKIWEDNAWNGARWQYVGPGYSHRNHFDAEAMYFDNDASNAYLAVITGLPRYGYDVPGRIPRFYPGDIGLDINNDGVYEYGIDTSSYNSVTKKARLYSGLTSGNWRNVFYPSFSSANPYAIRLLPGSFQWIDFVYSANQNSHYVLEAGIPLSYLGLNANSNHNLNIHWTMQCGNDYLNLAADVNAIPEPATLSLLGLGLLGLIKLRLRKK